MGKTKKKSHAWIVILVIVLAGAALFAQFGLTFVWKQGEINNAAGGCDFDYRIRNSVSEDYCIRTEYYDFSSYDGTLESVRYTAKRTYISGKEHEEILNLYARSEYVPEGFDGITGLSASELKKQVEADPSYDMSDGDYETVLKNRNYQTLKLGIEGEKKSVDDTKTGTGNPDGSSNIFATVYSSYGTCTIARPETDCLMNADIPRGRILAIIGLDEHDNEQFSTKELQRLEWLGNEEAIVDYLSSKKVVIVVKLDPKGDADKGSRVGDALKERAGKFSRWMMTGGKLYAGVVDEMFREARTSGTVDEHGKRVEKDGTDYASGGVISSDMAAMMSAYAMTMSNPQTVETVDLPEKSTDLSVQLAKEALTLCTGHSKSGQAEVLLNSGFDVLLQKGYDKKDEDTSHTCAFTVGKKLIDFYGQARTLLVVAVRGTNAGEWVSNFNFAEEKKDDTVYAENFLQSGESLYLNLIPILSDYPDAVILVCGHSRGAAAANMLGMMIDDRRGQDGVYVYTFATPTIYRGDDGITGYENIFNFINPADVVPHLPLEGWGFGHIGIDIVLPNEPDSIERIETAMQDFVETAPTIKAYYSGSHSLVGADTGTGSAENSFTTYQIMLAMASSMTGIKYDGNGRRNMADMYAIMDGSETGSESAYAGLFARLDKVIGRDGTWGMDIFGQHMPMAYTALIDAYGQILEQLPPMLTPKMLSGKNLMDLNEEEITKMLMPAYMQGVDPGASDLFIAPVDMSGMDLSGMNISGMNPGSVDIDSIDMSGMGGLDISGMSAEDLANMGLGMPGMDQNGQE